MGTRVNGVDLDAGTSVALSDATPAALGTASPGVSTEASRADHVHEAPAGPTRTDVDLSSATGWTTAAGTGGPTAAVDTASEQIELSVPAGVALGQRFALAYHGGYLDGTAMDVQLRIRAATLDASVQDYVQLLLIDITSAVFLQARVDGTGRVTAQSSSGAGAGVTVAGILGGQGWLRLVQLGGTCIVYAGVGSGGAPPTTWTACGAVGSATVTPLLVRLRVGIQRDAAGTGTASADVGDITVARSVLL